MAARGMERFRGRDDGRATHTEGIFPFIRVFTSVVVRELQTMAILLDLYLGVPIIYSTFMQYDEMATISGPGAGRHSTTCGEPMPGYVRSSAWCGSAPAAATTSSSSLITA